MKNPTVVFTGPRQVVIEDLEMPVPKAEHVLIQSELTLVSTGTELTVLGHDVEEGSQWASSCHYLFFPGYSNVGVVLDVGPGVDRGLIGKRVQSYGRHA